ncbi:hypothetical protein M409DRAFT_23010 [Zasmidium cellare ATCC 36951]|uniref:Enoyl reductase (ER) domain-containing protein n=1 Tax=Zasmidium cellare ATCC 36951 TaxID=1080233 RepID=A0A6A6CII6_ZASCE|nr:uncharacterized protein M409DRAFT_23010 [Zasmidium cellare ATCC 36951]KAF2166965.1 hypothetical protein M409DRAFT_23010 [Zasmidium cellare ATCC 36951]
MSAPTNLPQNFALIRKDTGIATLQPRPIPTLAPDYLLVRTVAIALNPTDWTTLDAPGLPGSVVGCDYAGVVEAVGSECRDRWNVGDRVAGFAHGGNDSNHETGAFARFIIVKGALQMKVPEGVGFEEAASVGSGVATTGYALYHVAGLPWPGEERGEGDGEPILIYGGSTATGTMAMQFAQMSGRKVLTTCSPKHFDLMKSRGAHAVYDYHTPNIGTQILSDTHSTLTTTLDCIAIASSAQICATATGPQGGTYINLLGIDSPRPDITSIFFLGYALTGEDYIFEGEFYAKDLEVHAFGVRWMAFAERLWGEGRWVAHPRVLKSGGLRGALAGMEEMRRGRGPSGVKWVYWVEETGCEGE